MPLTDCSVRKIYFKNHFWGAEEPLPSTCLIWALYPKKILRVSYDFFMQNSNVICLQHANYYLNKSIWQGFAFMDNFFYLLFNMIRDRSKIFYNIAGVRDVTSNDISGVDIGFFSKKS